MEFIKEGTHFDFLARRRIAATVSLVVILGGVVAYFAMGGLNYGIDFRGGTLIQVRLPEQPRLGEIRGLLDRPEIGAFQLQSFGEAEANEVLITLGAAQEAQTITEARDSVVDTIEEVMREAYPEMDVRRVETVGPRVGEELRVQAFQAVVFALLAILAYVSLRFQWRFGLAAVGALVHDVLIVVFAFVLTQKEITLPVVAAVLTVAGYSINDSIVILDRIRDNLRRFQKQPLLELLNESLNQTLSRTLLTSGTTLLVVLSIYLFGGEIINDFAFALLIGVLVGTYSSIYVATPLLLTLHRWFPPKVR